MGKCQHGSQKTSRNPATSFFYFIALVTVVSVLIGCVRAATVPATSNPTITPKPAAEVAPSISSKMLGIVPDAPETRAYVRIIDHARLGEALAFAPQSDDSPMEEVQQLRQDCKSLRYAPTWLMAPGEGWT